MTETAAGLDRMDVVPNVGHSPKDMNYLGSLNVADILGEPNDANASLAFDSVQVFAVDGESTSGEQVLELRFDAEPLRAERFLDLLEAIAPTPLPWSLPDEAARSILADWVVYEGESEQMRNLATAHAGLKGWAQLGEEYPDLKAALAPVENFRLHPWMIPGNEKIIKPDEFIQGWGNADGLAQHDPLISGSEFVQLLNDVYGPKEARYRIIQSMKHISQEKAGNSGLTIEGIHDDELFQVFSDLDIETRNYLINVSEIQGTYSTIGGSWTSNVQTEQFNALYLQRHTITFRTEDGQLMYAHGINPDVDIERAYADRKRIYAGADRPRLHGMDRGMSYEYEVMDVDTVIGKQTVIIPGSIHFEELGLVPAIRWSVGSDGKRTQKTLPEHQPLTSYKQNVLSNVTGYMVLAYLQPDKRSQWMKQARLPAFDVAQDMGPAQVPLIALQQANRLLENDLIQQAESLV